MNNPLLSICIPTYNRSNYLKVCLDSIISQFANKEISGQVEIVISDNASTDDTQETIAEFKKKFSNIKYSRNNKNLGFDRNLLKVIDESTGKYCLILGDDDALFPESLSVILNKITETKALFLELNYRGYDHNLQKPISSSPGRKITEDVIFKSLYDFVHSIKKYPELVGNFGGISTKLFLREPWVNYKEKELFVGSQCAHLFILLTVFKDKPYAQIAIPLIKTRSSNVRWETFTGLETASGRIKETIKSVMWIKEKYNLPISDLKINFYFLSREYWFTLKEIIKKMLSKLGLGDIINYYRKTR